MVKNQKSNIFILEGMCVHSVKNQIIEEVVKYKFFYPLS